MISIVIPTYNRSCYTLVQILAQQCGLVPDLQWEVVIVDDASTDASVRGINKMCAQIDNVRIVQLDVNLGRAAVRNRAVDESVGEWIVFLDDDVMPADERFVLRYVKMARKGRYDVVCGGVNAVHKKEDETSLRWIYDAYGEGKHSLQWRREHPYQCFSTANFMIRRSVFDHVRFDETLQKYGYEDALFGIRLEEEKVRLRQTGNPVEHLGLEPNEVFVRKTEQALVNLHSLGVPMTSRATVSRTLAKIEKWHMRWALTLWHKLFGRLERKLLCSNYPSVHVFQIYKLGYYADLK